MADLDRERRHSDAPLFHSYTWFLQYKCVIDQTKVRKASNDGHVAYLRACTQKGSFSLRLLSVSMRQEPYL